MTQVASSYSWLTVLASIERVNNDLKFQICRAVCVHFKKLLPYYSGSWPQIVFDLRRWPLSLCGTWLSLNMQLNGSFIQLLPLQLLQHQLHLWLLLSHAVILLPMQRGVSSPVKPFATSVCAFSIWHLPTFVCLHVRLCMSVPVCACVCVCICCWLSI